MPTRYISLEEAQFRKWPYFYIGTPCRYGHVAPRYTSNARICVDCHRAKTSKPPIGEKTGLDTRHFSRKNNKQIVVKVEKPQQVDSWEKKFLEAYAYHKDFKAACASTQVAEAQIDARLAYSEVFKKAYDSLEERLGIKKVKDSSGFIWTTEKYNRLIEVYINTGDMATARDAIDVTPFEYFQEIARNIIFAARIKEADPLAHLALEERAIQLALAGNDKLLTKVLSVKKPEYRENIKVDMNVTEKLDDRELNSKLNRLLEKLRPSFIEAEVTDLGASRADPVPRVAGRARKKAQSKEDQPVLQLTSG
jgi:hypothetical protein